MAFCEAQPTIRSAHVEKFPSLMARTPGLPGGFPDFVDSPLAWAGEQFTDENEFIHVLSDDDILELEAALDHFKGLGLDGDHITKDTFPLPNLASKLDIVRQDLHNGKGFGLVRGLDPKKYLVEDLTMLYLGIQTHVANQTGRQDSKGNMLVHIIADNSSKVKAGHHRHSTEAITFHNEEAGDIVSWLTRSVAASGGKCIIASAYAVYNVLAADRPDLVRALAGGDWPFALPRFQCRPVLFNHNGRLIINFGRTPLVGSASHPRSSQLPGLSLRQMEALDAVEELAKSFQLEIVTRAGDIHFINNLAILHRREGFQNGTSSGEKRHLVRMRLRDDELAWALPEELQEEWSSAFDDTKTSKVWHLEPMPDGYFPLRSQTN
ncbi:unnamed protein product [Clonostachys rhizophaga]|uniref:TauD/TfdA-like domain-containing protein n=1 Tax=Clonostachys rhizophaga TaxID=160324 RepID=A0A9N9VQJ2_9HYPO|nr:unnamed protein product [Clonostachys rhizophaga]